MMKKVGGREEGGNKVDFSRVFGLFTGAKHV